MKKGLLIKVTGYERSQRMGTAPLDSTSLLFLFYFEYFDTFIARRMPYCRLSWQVLDLLKYNRISRYMSIMYPLDFYTLQLILNYWHPSWGCWSNFLHRRSFIEILWKTTKFTHYMRKRNESQNLQWKTRSFFFKFNHLCKPWNCIVQYFHIYYTGNWSYRFKP